MFGAGNQVRTGDLYLGKVPLYQLSYSRFLSLPAVRTTDCFYRIRGIVGNPIEWRPLGESNPCCQDENLES